MSQYVLIFIGFLLFLGFLKSFFTVKQQTAAIMERFGRFHSIRTSGLQLKIPFVDKIVARVGLKIQQLDVIVETKTKDDVFVNLDRYGNTSAASIPLALDEAYQAGLISLNDKVLFSGFGAGLSWGSGVWQW